MWTLQEIMVSTNPVVFIGDMEIEWSIFSTHNILFLCSQFGSRGQAIAFTQVARLGQPKQIPLVISGPAEFLLNTQTQQCSDPRDRVFSLHWIFKRRGIEWPKPDYTKAPEKAFQEASICTFKYGQRLTQLMLVHPLRKLSNSPSWMYDIGGKGRNFPGIPVSGEEVHDTSTNERFLCGMPISGGVAPLDAKVVTLMPDNRLILRGKVVAKVVLHSSSSSFPEPGLGPTSAHDEGSTDDDLIPITARLRRWFQHINDQSLHHMESLSVVLRSILSGQMNPLAKESLEPPRILEWIKTITSSCSSMLLEIRLGDDPSFCGSIQDRTRDRIRSLKINLDRSKVDPVGLCTFT
jgi:hypothetical protein